MEIIIKDDLVIKKRNQTVFEALPDDVICIKLMAGRKYYPPTIFAKWIKFTLHLKSIILFTETKSITLI